MAGTALALVACDGAAPAQPPSLRVTVPEVVARSGDPFTVSVEYLDADGDRVRASGESVSLSIEAHPEAPQLEGELGTTLQDGLAESSVLIDRAGSGFVVVARSGTAVGRSAPITVELRLASLSVSGHHACGLDERGAAYCWGRNTLGSLGVPATAFQERPRRVPLPLPLIEISTGLSGGPTNEGFTCGLGIDGRVYCWGINTGGELGRGTTESVSTVPQPIDSPLTFVKLDAGPQSACAMTASGEIYCWGYDCCGFPTPFENPQATGTPRRIELDTFAPGRQWSDIVVGHRDSCALSSAGEAWCWWRGDPEPTPGPVRFAQLSPGVFSTCGVSPSGDGYCWGSNEHSALGTGKFKQDESQPTPVAGSKRWTTIETSGYSTCGIDTNGKLFCWGDANGLPLGDLPTAVLDSLRFTDLSYASNGGCGITDDGAGYCWGYFILTGGEVGDVGPTRLLPPGS